MNLRVLEYVIAVAEHGGVTRAEEELRVSQPALSKAIQQLKEEYGALVSEGRGEPVEGELSVAVPPESAVDYLPQRLAGFHEEYRDVRVRISTAEGELGVLDLARSAS